MQPDHRHLFAHLAATERRLNSGETLFFAGDPVRQMVLITTGQVNLVRRTAEGATVILQKAGPGDILAEASAYSATYHCGAEAVVPSAIRLLPIAIFRNALRDDPVLAEAWASHLARSVQAARMQAEIRTLRKVAERVDAWLGCGHNLPDKGHMQDLAAELGVTREALYREFARRK